jgi:hypothetical protein
MFRLFFNKIFFEKSFLFVQLKIVSKNSFYPETTGLRLESCKPFYKEDEHRNIFFKEIIVENI